MMLKHNDRYHNLAYGTLCFFAQTVQNSLKLMQMEIVILVLK